jgi:hypothetical protein
MMNLEDIVSYVDNEQSCCRADSNHDNDRRAPKVIAVRP